MSYQESGDEIFKQIHAHLFKMDATVAAGRHPTFDDKQTLHILIKQLLVAPMNPTRRRPISD
jgi:hypothetical protein